MGFAFIVFILDCRKVHFAFKEHSVAFFHSHLLSILSSLPQLEILDQIKPVTWSKSFS